MTARRSALVRATGELADQPVTECRKRVADRDQAPQMSRQNDIAAALADALQHAARDALRRQPAQLRSAPRPLRRCRSITASVCVALPRIGALNRSRTDQRDMHTVLTPLQ